jgi:hypothetical protein
LIAIFSASRSVGERVGERQALEAEVRHQPGDCPQVVWRTHLVEHDVQL